MTQLITPLGPKKAGELGMILPHEHVFVNLRTWDQAGYPQAEAVDVVQLMVLEIEKAQATGVTAISEVIAEGVRAFAWPGVFQSPKTCRSFSCMACISAGGITPSRRSIIDCLIVRIIAVATEGNSNPASCQPAMR